MFESYRNVLKRGGSHLVTSLRDVIFAVLSGIILGFVGTAFYYGMQFVTRTRLQHPWLIFLLPGAGAAIVGLYQLLHDEKDTGTNLVLSAIHSNENIPLRMAPLIFIATLLTHLFGGSAGREGAALQLGGSIGNSLGKLFHFDEKDPAHYDHVWYECCFLRIVWHTAGCCDLFHGSGQCRHYALFRTAAMCHRITDRSRCGSRLWHYTGNLSDQFYSGICTENRSDHRCICCVMRGGQHLILYDPAQCRTSV